ncbi:unnamed protein product [Camellia sinensis]
MAAAVVGGAFLSATLQVLFDRLASREFVNFFRAQKLDDKLLRKLKSTLRGLNVLLDDAEDKQITNAAVKDWVDELKVAVYHADDLLDEIATEALRCKSEAKYHSGSDQVPSPTLISSSSSFDADIVSKIEEIIDRLEYFAKEKDVLGLREVAGQKLYHRLPTTSLVDDSGVCGRDNDKEDVIKLLLSDEANGGNQKIDVIAIVGMGGVGKTTLAQFLYNDGRVDDQVTRTILEEVIPQGSDTMDLSKKDLNQLQVKLKECLSGKKFLIVLDDVWNENYDDWDSLRNPFGYGEHGSRVIVTTRNESVSSIMQTVPIHRLQQLSDEDCWKLFAKHAFEKGDCGAHPNLERIGKEIVKKCKGLPLATKTLAGLLRSKRDVEDWNNILKSGIWDLPKGKSNILPALKLSYYYLPSHLKRCFAYCSIFPKDYEFEMERLVLMWMAEGFVEQPRSNKTREEVGYECFYELQSRSFFQRSNVKKYCFVMHDLVNDLAQAVSGDFCYMLEDNNTHHISERVHHFSCVRGRFDGFEKYKLINDAKFLRTFLALNPAGYSYWRLGNHSWLSKKVLDDILPKLTSLRILSLPRYKIMELPHSIGNLLHLRYLDLSYTEIKQLPESVCTMYNLETLLLYNCNQLTTLPEMPMQMSQLKGLQLLTAFVVGKSKGLGIEELKEFRHLQRRLSISSLQNVTNGMGAMEAKLEEKMYLEELVLEWSSSTNDSQNERDVLDKLKPHTNLKRLEIKNFGGTRFPDWLGDESFCNIVHLSLDNCKYCFSLPPFGQLPSLKDLKISRMQGITKVGHEFYGDSSLSKPFQSLETLRFEEMLEWVDWYILESGEFSKLKVLEVIKCPELIGGLPKHIPSCVRLVIQECSKLTSELVLKGCDGVELGCRGLSSLTELEISDMPNLKELTPELCTLTNLKVFTVWNCPSLLSFPDTGLPPMLTQLLIENCKVLVFPKSEDMENCCRSLETLTLICCDALKPMWLGFFPKLRSLEILYCTNFNSITDLNMLGLQNLTSLESLFLGGFFNLISVPRGGLPGLNLTHFRISQCKKLKSLPEGMHTLFPSLQSLSLWGCPEIESFPEGGLPSSLHSLEIPGCSKLIARRREWDLQRLPSLRHFRLAYEDGVESFPEEGLLPSTLMSLSIENLPNLKSLNNRGLQLLGSLKYMKIVRCPQLQSLVEEGLPTSLVMLEFFGCPMLKPRYLKGEGQDWHKIACVPVIHMDGEVIFDQLTLRPAMDSPPDPLDLELDAAIGDHVERGNHSGMSKMLMIFYHDVEVNVFFGYVYSKEVLVTALEGSTSIVQMILYVSQEPAFSDISAKVVQSEHVSAICSLVASIQRSAGLWQLQEVLSCYKWLEYLETDFVFGSSSIGSVTPQYLAAFSAAFGKTSVQFSESKESDPDWGCWSASQEIRNPSVRIIFPTIERVKNASCGILASKYLVCFSQKTWQRLRNVGMLHDAILYPNDRVNHPVRVKVAGKCFHAAAWGRPISISLRTKAVGAVKTNSVLGSRLHLCNYELGIVFIVPPSDANSSPNHKSPNLDDIILPFVMPALKYRPSDTPATKQAMREALAEHEREISMEAVAFEELMEEEEDIADEEEEVLEATDYVAKEREDEKAYADILWSQS